MATISGTCFRARYEKFPTIDGDLIFDELVREAQFPTHRPVDSRKLYKKTAYRLNRAHSEKGEVVVPEREYEPIVETVSGSTDVAAPSEATTHTEIKWLLLKLGSDMGLSVWIARNDKNKEFNERRFTDVPNTVKELPHQFVEAVQKTIELIDVLWLKKDAIVGAFEIESTASIYSGLLRMSDLM